MALEKIKGYGPGCPFCGSIRSTCLERGWSEPDDNYLRKKRCNECSESFVTAEVVVPPGRTTFYRLDHYGRQYRRNYYRTRKAKTELRMPQNTRASDQLHVRIRVTTTPAQDKVCYRGHPWSPENIYINPSSGDRRCKACRYITQRAYHERIRAERAAAAQVKAA